MSQRTSPTEAGDVNRRTEEEKGREHNSGTSAEFGQKVGRSENLEGGNMRNRNDEPLTNIGGTNTGSEIREDESSSRRSSGSMGSSGSTKTSGSDKWRDESDSSTGQSGRDDSGSTGSSSEGRH